MSFNFWLIIQVLFTEVVAQKARRNLQGEAQIFVRRARPRVSGHRRRGRIMKIRNQTSHLAS